MRKIRLKPTESYCQKYLYTKIMTSKCKIIKYKLNANIFFQIYFCSTFSVRIQKVKINWKGRRLFERRHSKNTIWFAFPSTRRWPVGVRPSCAEMSTICPRSPSTTEYYGSFPALVAPLLLVYSVTNSPPFARQSRSAFASSVWMRASVLMIGSNAWL